MPDSRFAERLMAFMSLSDAEYLALAQLEQRVRTLRRGQVLVRGHDVANDLYILRAGVAMSYVILGDGSRQILEFHYPGDMLATSNLAYARTPETIAALGDVAVASFDRQAMADLIVDHPRLSGAIMALAQIERVALTDRLAFIGRASAKARVAAQLLETRNRMADASASPERSFTLGLTQEEIGDANGLTAVHVNRMLRQLEEDGLIAREGGRFTIIDEHKLRRIANYVDRVESINLGWLPRSR